MNKYTEMTRGYPFVGWIVFLRLGANTKQERAIRSAHEDIDSILREQNVAYTEITTQHGKSEAYKKFGVRDRDHPLFLIMNQPPAEYTAGDQFIVVEWGKWKDEDELKTDLMRLANFFSDEEFIKQLAREKEVKAWERLLAFTREQGVSAVGVGASILAAL